MLQTYLDGRQLVTVECSVLVPVHVAGLCDRCGAPLTGRRTRWCSYSCEVEYRQNHDWSLARKAARKRDGYRCVRCGSTEQLECNHMIPREGRGYGWGCHNHLELLETLCHVDHVLVTREQVAARALAAVPLPRRRRHL
jgi:5-methylcytosine-specific restriction endonuclease McrA